MRPPVALLAHAVDEPRPLGVLADGRVLPGVGGAALGPGARGARPLHRPAGRAHAGVGTARREPHGRNGRHGRDETPRRRATDGRPGARRRARAGGPARPCSPRPPGTTIPSAGGRTWSSTGAPGRGTRSRRSPRSRRRWRAARDATATRRARRGTSCGRRTCGIQVRAAQQGVRRTRWPWCAGRGTCPRCAGSAALAADRALLKGLPKVRADMTWVPWTHRRLARAGGYGAGIDVARLVRPPVRGPGPAGRAVADQGGRAAARARTGSCPRRTSSRRYGSPRRSPRCAAARCPG